MAKNKGLSLNFKNQVVGVYKSNGKPKFAIIDKIKKETEKSSEACHNIINKSALEAFSSPQSPLSEEEFENIRQILSKHYNEWDGTLIDKLESFIYKQRQEAYEEGKKAENERLEKKAKEYKEKGFELETFIYSGFVELLSGNKE